MSRIERKQENASPPGPEGAQREAGIPMVGLGGSAGALAAFEAFFEAMPADSGAAFVVIQHMSPDHASLLPEILSHHTQMPVVQAQDGTRPEANHVYVIPSDRNLGLRSGVFCLSAPPSDHSMRMSIDFFFRCLAEDREERGICVLFSGAGSDGTLGARAVRAAGGMVLVQDPQTAQFADMPHSAIVAEIVDQILPPGRMPEVILHYLRHPYVRDLYRGSVLEALAKPTEYEDILGLVLAQTGSDFRCYKLPTILRRIGRRMGLLRIPDMGQYAARLHTDPEEVRQLVKDLLINVTAFFRDGEAFDELRDTAIAPLVRNRPGGEPLRVWVPACSTGEEAYSLAILFMEQLEKAGKGCPVQVFATDLDEEALETARAGFYPENIVTDVGEERLAKFFIHKDRGFQVKESLREALTFAVQNVITDPPFSKMDLVSCRNLLIYLDTDAQSKLMALFNFALKPGGFLFLGRSESAACQSDLFEPVSKKGRLCRRLAPTRPILLDSPILPGRRRPILPAHPANGLVTSNFADVVRFAILRHFGASAVLIDRKGQILQFHGQTDKYLNLPAPGPRFNLFDLAKEKLVTKLRLAIHKAVQDDRPVVLNDVPFTSKEGDAFARITAVPVAQKSRIEPLLVVFFEDASGPATAEAEVIHTPEQETMIARLEDELRVTQQDLQSSIEELQSSNEELRAANEEVTSTNEELESTNEELVSSTEELQSTNEEMTAVINQLQEKVNLLDQANEATHRSEERFRILVESSPNAVLLAGADGRITLANRQAETMFGYTRNELIGQAVEVLMPGRFRERHPSYRIEFAAKPQARPMGAGRDLFAVRKDGREFPVEIGLTPLAMPEGLVIMATITDITERKRLEKPLS